MVVERRRVRRGDAGAAARGPGYADPVVFAGKLGHAAALPSRRTGGDVGQGRVRHGRDQRDLRRAGPAGAAGDLGLGQGVAANVFTQLGLDTPACDAGIYEVSPYRRCIPRTCRIVDTRTWHEIMPRAVVPYAAVHGVELPTLSSAPTRARLAPELPRGHAVRPAGRSLDPRPRDAPVGGIHFVGEHQFNLQGTDTIDYSDDDLCGMRILGVQPNRGDNNYQQIANIAGERVVILGEFGVRNLDDAGPLLDPSGNPDTSFLVRFPANTPYLMQGIDCDGHTLNTDQSWQSLRPGEMKTCGGCHVHSKDVAGRLRETASPRSPTTR